MGSPSVKKTENGYQLVKQSFGALEPFIDCREDYLFDGYNETNFSISLDSDYIEVNYYYMRGSAKYIFKFKKGDWYLNNYYIDHRTCCTAKAFSYNYETKEYHYSSSRTDTDSEESDTTYTIIEDRPLILMDSLFINDFYFNETGILIR